MGSEYSKCCRKLATHQIIVKLPIFHVGDIEERSGRKKWIRYDNQGGNTVYMNYVCNECYFKLKTHLNRSHTDFVHIRSKEGFLKYTSC